MHVEFLGIPRERAGVSEIEIEARTLGQVPQPLRALVAPKPAVP